MPASGTGFYSYQAAYRLWGTPEMIYGLQRATKRFKQEDSRRPRVGFGDISKENGGYCSPHVTHRYGVDVDVTPMRNDGREGPVTIFQSAYSRPLTQRIMDLMRAEMRVTRVLFNDKKTRGTLPVRLTVEARPPSVSYEVWVSNNPLELDVSRYGLGHRLRGQRRQPVLPVPVLRDSARQARLEAAVQNLLGPVGLDRLMLDHYRLRGEERAFFLDTEPERLLDVFRTLGRIARLCQRTEVSISGMTGRHFAWSEGGALRCPYCHDSLSPQELDLTSCPGCRTLHHGECFDEAGGCTLLGCTRSRTQRLAWRPRTTRRAKV